MPGEIPLDQHAVFSRNYLRHLRAAARLNRGKIAVFQSNQLWHAARRAVNYRKRLKRSRVFIYFAVVDRDPAHRNHGCVEFVAQLVDVRLAPAASDAEWLRRHALSTTRSEGLWGQTLYAITNCKPIEPFPMTSLRRALKIGTKLDGDYRWSYAIVADPPAQAKLRNP